MPADLPSVRPGQIWADNDPRLRRDGRERHVEVLDLFESRDPFNHSVIRKARVRDLFTGRETNIRVDRFRPNSTGYRLLTEAPESAPEASDAR